ncbi:MAG TPA: FG-GAP-like repeat-containing protein [Pyrinomonadaceae bacterium]|nr:FG-GAP-like repeat-containing protein [Pyrinomonadaceae bacterium]
MKFYLIWIGACLFTCAFLLSPFSTPTHAAPSSFSAGIVDPTFHASIGFEGRVYCAVRQTDGKLVIAGRFTDVSGHRQVNVARLLDNGLRDPSFNPPLLLDPPTELAIQPDGKILLSFFASSVTPIRAKIVRLNVDGSLDTSFVSGQGTSGSAIGALLPLPDGDILVGGEFSSYNGVIRQCLIRLNNDGSVDQAFTTEVTGFSSVVTSLIQAPDGKIYVAGLFTQIGGMARGGVARLHPDGTVDHSFNSNISQRVNEVMLSGTGKLYVGGRFNIGSNLYHIARLDELSGTLDSAFTGDVRINTWVDGIGLHTDGRVFVYGGFPSSTQKVYLLNSNGSVDDNFAVKALKGGIDVREVLPRSDGKFDIVGSFQDINGSAHCSLARLTSTYAVDQTYNPYLVGGTTLGSEVISSVVFQPDGKILVAGTFTQIDGYSVNSIGRLNADGSPDETFNQGDVIYRNGSTEAVRAVALQPDGKIVIGGGFPTINGNPTASVARLNPDGTVDTTFSLPGTDVQIYSVALQPDGKILIGGQFNFIRGEPRKYVARLNADGTLDTSFDMGSLVNAGYPTKIIVQPDGKILVSGVRNTSETQWSTIVRLNSNGTRDTSFNAVISPGNPDMELEPDGQLFIGGSFSSVNGQPRTGLARLNADGSVDPTFTGQVAVTGGSNVSGVKALSSGEYLAVGQFTVVNGITRPGIARFKTDGALDVNLFAGHTQQGGVTKVFVSPSGKMIFTGGFYLFNNSPQLGMLRMIVPSSTAFDFDGDGKTDVGIFRPTSGQWWINQSSNGNTTVGTFGASTDLITPADFTGDGKTDIAFFRPSNGFWFILRSEDFSYFSLPFGSAGDVPVPGDFDGDGKADLTVFRSSTSTWYIRRSSDGGTTIQGFGSLGDIPVPADYDGDGRTDIGIYRPSNGQWWIQRSTAGVTAITFGVATDKPVQGDYTGDGKADMAYFRPSTGQWYILRSENYSFYSVPFGTTDDTPAPGDYDGDGKFDTTVFRPSTTTWYSQRSTAGLMIQQFGSAGDRPIPNAFVP